MENLQINFAIGYKKYLPVILLLQLLELYFNNKSEF